MPTSVQCAVYPRHHEGRRAALREKPAPHCARERDALSESGFEGVADDQPAPGEELRQEGGVRRKNEQIVQW